MIARAKKRGIVTYEEINAALPPEDQHTSELIEDIMSELSEMGVNVVEDDGRDDDVSSQDPEPQGEDVFLRREKTPTQPHSDGTVFDLIEKNPPEYDAYWPRSSSWQANDHPAHNKLTVSFSELKALDSCTNIDWVKKTYFDKAGEHEQLSARDVQAAGCDFDDVFWAAGMLSAYSPLAAARLTDFAADCLQLIVDRLEQDRSERDTLLDTVRATRDFAAGKCSVYALLRETAKAQQAWMRVVIPIDAGIRFPWDKFLTNDHSWPTAAFLPPMWEEWAKGVAWAVATCLALRPNCSALDDDAWQRRNEHEDWLLSRIVHWFAPEGPAALPSHFDGDPLIGAEKWAGPAVPSVDLNGFAFAVLPDDCRRIESLCVMGDTNFELPYGLRSIGLLDLDRCHARVAVPEGVVRVDKIDLLDSYLDLPSSVESVSKITLYGLDDCLGCDGVREFGVVELQYAYFTFPEGVEAIRSLQIQASDTHLPASLKIIGDVCIDDENRGNFGEDEPARTLYWQEGPTEVGRLELGEGIQMTLPRSIQTIASVRLATGAHLRLSQDTVIIGPCEVADGATLERLPASHYEHVGRIDLSGDEALKL